MAPVQGVSHAFSRLSTYLKQSSSSSLDTRSLGARSLALVKRSYTPTGAGVTEPGDVPNTFIFVLIGLIGAGFVITGIWFFFWAKNGGIIFRENDWDEYKSTVLRRKGPNGTTLSGATESTDLGGGSIYKDYDNDESVISEKRKAKSKAKKWKKSRKAKSEATVDEEAALGGGEYQEAYGPDDDVRAYRHEKAARVGGMNREADGSAWDGSTNPSASTVDSYSDLTSERSEKPKHTPTRVRKHRKKHGYTPSEVSSTNGIRTVAGSVTETTTSSSYWSGTSQDPEFIRSEARKLQEKGRGAMQQRRDFSFSHGTEESMSVADDQEARNRRREERRRKSRSPAKKGAMIIPSTLSETDDGDLGTKSYHCVIPGLSSVASVSAASAAGDGYAEERRKRRNGGYRRARGNDHSDMEDVDMD